MKLTRRKALTGLVALGADLYLESQGIGLVTGTRRALRKPISQEDYEQTLKATRRLGLGVDDAHSTFREGSKTLIVYLPDVHQEWYARKQRERIAALDRGIDFDIIGLEGLVGRIDVEAIRERLEQTKVFHRENTINHVWKDPSCDYDIKDTDNSTVRLQKLKVNLCGAIDDFMCGDSVRRDHQDHKKDFHGDRPLENPCTSPGSKRFRNYLNFQLALGTLNAYLPTRFKTFFEIQDIVDYLTAKEFEGSNPRLGAPGTLYFDQETRAKKVGMETKENDDRSYRVAEAHSIHDLVKKIEKAIEEVSGFYLGLKRDYSNLGPEQENYQRMEEAFNDYISSFRKYLKKMEDFRDQLLADEPEELRQEILNTTGDSVGPRYDEIVINQRSRDWVRNTSSKRLVMMIGGLGHTDTIYDSADDENCSIISLADLR